MSQLAASRGDGGRMAPVRVSRKDACSNRTRRAFRLFSYKIIKDLVKRKFDEIVYLEF